RIEVPPRERAETLRVETLVVLDHAPALVQGAAPGVHRRELLEPPPVAALRVADRGEERLLQTLQLVVLDAARDQVVRHRETRVDERVGARGIGERRDADPPDAAIHLTRLG